LKYEKRFQCILVVAGSIDGVCFSVLKSDTGSGKPGPFVLIF